MAYSNFTLAKLTLGYGIEQKQVDLFTEIKSVEPSTRLKADIEEAQILPKNTEKARSEYFVSPILRDVFRRNKEKVTLFSGYGLNVEKGKSALLKGNCDFIFAARPHLVELEAPIFCIAEAKNGVVEDAYGQCGAELYAARLFNKEFGRNIDAIYGVATNGFEWTFMLLNGNQLLIDSERLLLNDLPQLLGTFQWIIDQNHPSVKNDKSLTVN